MGAGGRPAQERSSAECRGPHMRRSGPAFNAVLQLWASLGGVYLTVPKVSFACRIANDVAQAIGANLVRIKRWQGSASAGASDKARATESSS